MKTRGKFWACLETFQPEFSSLGGCLQKNTREESLVLGSRRRGDGWAVIKRSRPFATSKGYLSIPLSLVSLPRFLISCEKGGKKVKVGKNSSRGEKWEFVEKRMELFLVMKISWWEARERERERDRDRQRERERERGGWKAKEWSWREEMKIYNE